MHERAGLYEGDQFAVTKIERIRKDGDMHFGSLSEVASYILTYQSFFFLIFLAKDKYIFNIQATNNILVIMSITTGAKLGPSYSIDEVTQHKIQHC